jgi:flagellar basal-body rod protein FlgB
MEDLNTNQINYSDPLNVLQQTLQGLSTRSKAITSNIANANTDAYQRKTISFEERLQNQILKNQESNNLQQNHPTHFNSSGTTANDFNSLIEERIDETKVDVEREMLNLTTTGLKFKAVASMTKKYIENLRGIIRG